MSLLFRERPQEVRGVRLPAWIREAAGFADGLVAVDSDSSMRHDAVWSCRTRIAQDVSMLPVDVLRYVGGARQPVEPVPQIIAAPSAVIDADTWRYQVVDGWLSDGNAWGLVTATTTNMLYPTRIELVAQSRVRVETLSGRVRYYVDNVEHDLWPVGDLWHKPAYTVAGSVLGLSPIAYHAVTIGAGLAAEQYGSDFFTRGAHPSAILAPEKDPGPDGAKGLKEAFLKATRGREPAVLPQSVKYEQVQTNPEDSQFIDTMRYTAEQVCRIFGEDPADHGVSTGGKSMTYANRTDADLARFKRRQFWVVKLQNALTEMLPRPQVVRLNPSAALMMTARERHEIHGMRLNQRTTTINEVRRIEDETPFGPEYDEPGIPPMEPMASDPQGDDSPAMTDGGAA